MSATKTLVVRIPAGLHARANALAAATRVSVREMVEAGLAAELERRMDGNNELRRLVEQLTTLRSDASPRPTPA